MALAKLRVSLSPPRSARSSRPSPRLSWIPPARPPRSKCSRAAERESENGDRLFEESERRVVELLQLIDLRTIDDQRVQISDTAWIRITKMSCRARSAWAISSEAGLSLKTFAASCCNPVRTLRKG